MICFLHEETLRGSDFRIQLCFGIILEIRIILVEIKVDWEVPFNRVSWGSASLAYEVFGRAQIERTLIISCILFLKGYDTVLWNLCTTFNLHASWLNNIGLCCSRIIEIETIIRFYQVGRAWEEVWVLRGLALLALKVKLSLGLMERRLAKLCLCLGQATRIYDAVYSSHTKKLAEFSRELF